MFCAQSVVAGIALYAFISIDRGSIDGGINVDRSHGADVGAVPTGDAFVWIDFHSPMLFSRSYTHIIGQLDFATENASNRIFPLFSYERNSPN